MKTILSGDVPLDVKRKQVLLNSKLSKDKQGLSVEKKILQWWNASVLERQSDSFTIIHYHVVEPSFKKQRKQD